MTKKRKLSDTEKYFLDVAATELNKLKEKTTQVDQLMFAFSICCEFVDYTFGRLANDFTEKPKKS